ncbi:MAG: DUF3971 domain-containing protein [Pseudomonadota bacterium]
MHKKPKKPKKPKKHIVHRISITFAGSAFLLAMISIVYFLTLISIEYKSFPFITGEIEKKINQNLSEGSSIKIGKTALKFSQMYKIKIRFDDIRLNSGGKKELVLPKIEAEFSIFNLVLLKTIPSRLEIISPEIDFDNTSSKPKIAVNGITDQEMLLQQNSLQSLSQIFLSLKDGQVPIKNFSIIDAKINFKNKTNHQTITVKESRISTFFDNGYLHLVSENKINFDPLLPNLEIKANCQFKKVEGLKCEANFKNFLPASVAFLDSKLIPLKKITGDLDGNVNFVVDDNHQLAVASFDVSSKSGSFYYPQYFSDHIGFQNLIASGKLDNSLKTFSLDNLKCNFGDAKFAMSLSASDFLDPNKQKTVMQFKINNVQTDSLELLWPLFLNENNVRSWVINHIKDGVIKDGYATMIFASKNGQDHLQKIESELAFSGLSLQYHQNFPPISKIDGIASFNKNQMKIDISKGEVLKSKINFASVIIPDFNAKKTMLEIDGKVFGAAEDSLKHIGYKSEFAAEVDKYFSGKAETTLAIKLPITPHLKLQDVYIKVLSNIQSFNNDYISDSSLVVSAVKEFANNNFITEIDLTNANIHLKQFNIIKENGVASKIKTTLSFDGSDILYLKNFDWSQGDNNLSGNLSLQTQPIKIVEINLKNRNFANSNFDLNYKISNNSRYIKLKGKTLDLRTIFSDNSADSSDFKGVEHYQKNNIEIALSEVYLANQQKFKDLNIDLDCDGARCKSGFIKAKLNQKQNIDIHILKPSNNKNSSQVEGSFGDISIIAKALNLSNQIVDGDAKINAQIGDNGQLNGEIKIDSGFTILKNEVVEKIYSNNIFANLRDKILNSNEIKFDNLKLEFALKNNVIDINTLVASSSLMGFTAKGKIDLNENSTVLKGLIVPGYVLNKLFGIGQVPILGKIIVGEEGGGIFAIRYDYVKSKADKKGDFSINPASAVIPGGIRNVFDLF